MSLNVEKALKRIEIFQDLTEPLIQQLAQFSTLRTVTAGQTVFSQGEPSPDCFGIVSGQVSIRQIAKDPRYPDKLLGVLGAGTFFGESALFDAAPRAATALAAKDSELLAITGSKFRAWLANDPAHGQQLLLAMLHHTMSRLRRTSAELSVHNGMDRLLSGDEPIEKRLHQSLEFIKASVDGVADAVLYRRNPYWDEFEGWVRLTEESAPESAPLPLNDPLIQEILNAREAVRSSAKPDSVLIPLRDRDRSDHDVVGFLLVKCDRPSAGLPSHTMLLFSSLAAPLSETILRHRRQEELLALTRLHQGRQKYS